MFPAIAPFRLQTLATQRTELQAKVANYYHRQFRYNRHLRAKSVQS